LGIDFIICFTCVAIGYSAYNPNTGNNILMKLEELSIFKASVENNLGYNIENTPNYQNIVRVITQLTGLGQKPPNNDEK
jgi:hypothetical protein